MASSSSSNNIKRLFFDIDDTLYSTSEFARTARWNSVKALKEIGVNMSAEDMFQELQEVISEFSSNYPYHYDKLLLRLPDNALEEVDRDIAIAAAVIAYHRTKHEQLEPFPDVERFLNALEESSIPEKPGIITEGLSVKQAEKILRLNLYGFFDSGAIFISEKVGISKPNPKLFQTALEESETSPSQSIFVGDKPEKDIKPVNQVGMTSVLVQREESVSRRVDIHPDYTIGGFDELAELLRTDYDVSLPSL